MLIIFHIILLYVYGKAALSAFISAFSFLYMLLLIPLVFSWMNTWENQTFVFTETILEIKKTSLYYKEQITFRWEDIERISYRDYIPTRDTDSLQYALIIHRGHGYSMRPVTDKVPYLQTRYGNIFLLEFGTRKEKIQLYHFIRSRLKDDTAKGL